MNTSVSCLHRAARTAPGHWFVIYRSLHQSRAARRPTFFITERSIQSCKQASYSPSKTAARFSHAVVFLADRAHQSCKQVSSSPIIFYQYHIKDAPRFTYTANSCSRRSLQSASSSQSPLFSSQRTLLLDGNARLAAAVYRTRSDVVYSVAVLISLQFKHGGSHRWRFRTTTNAHQLTQSRKR